MTFEQQVTRQRGFSPQLCGHGTDKGMAVVEERYVKRNEPVAAFTLDKILGLRCGHKDGIADGPSGARPFGWGEVSWKEMPT